MQRANSVEKTLRLGKIKGKRRSRQQRMRWSDSITDSTDVNLSKLQEIARDRGAWPAAVHAVLRVCRDLATEQQHINMVYKNVHQGFVTDSP